MKLKVLFGMMLSILALTIVGCGGGSSTPAPVSTTVSGEASKGAITGGTVRIYAIDDKGVQSTTPLATSPTNVTTHGQFGNYSAVISYAGPVMVEVTGGTYTDEATQTPLVINQKLRAIVKNVTGSTKVAVTPFTEIAVRTAATAGLSLTPANIDIANIAAATAYGLHEVDIVGTLPSTLPKYNFALAVISQGAGTGTNDVSNLLTKLADAIDIDNKTVKTPSVSSDFATATASAFGNKNINPTNHIDGIIESDVANVAITAPTVEQQIKSQVTVSATVKRIDGGLGIGKTVDFTVTSGSGTFSVASAVTDNNGVATVHLTSPIEGTVGFTAHAHPFTAGAQVVFADLDRPATVTLNVDQLQGITKNLGPVTLSATVTRFGFGLVGPGLGSEGRKFVPQGTGVTFNTVGDGAQLSATIGTTDANGVATVTLNSTTAGNIVVTATAGTITSAPPVTVQFIDQPVTATLKLSTSGVLPAGVKISAVIGTLTLNQKLPGLTILAGANPKSATGFTASGTKLMVSGVATAAILLPAEAVADTPATTPVTTHNVLVSLASVNGFDIGEFATIVSDIKPLTFPKRTDFVLSGPTVTNGFRVIGVDASGNQVNLPDVRVDFILSLQSL